MPKYYFFRLLTSLIIDLSIMKGSQQYAKIKKICETPKFSTLFSDQYTNLKQLGWINYLFDHNFTLENTSYRPFPKHYSWFRYLGQVQVKRVRVVRYELIRRRVSPCFPAVYECLWAWLVGLCEDYNCFLLVSPLYQLRRRTRRWRSNSLHTRSSRRNTLLCRRQLSHGRTQCDKWKSIQTITVHWGSDTSRAHVSTIDSTSSHHANWNYPLECRRIIRRTRNKPFITESTDRQINWISANTFMQSTRGWA